MSAWAGAIAGDGGRCSHTVCHSVRTLRPSVLAATRKSRFFARAVPHPMNRRFFLAHGFTAATAFMTARAFGQTSPSTPTPAPGVPRGTEPARPPPLAPALVNAFVIAGHTNLPRVKELLATTPSLINASWDWGNGDFETALNGASHVGRREVALGLLAAGARLDAPCAAMLGETEMIATLVRLSPAAANVQGAHGYSLLYHAGHSGNVAIAESLAPHLARRARDCNQALQTASLAGHTDFVAWLLKHGVDNPNTTNFQGRTPLDLATERNHEKVMSLLREAGGRTTR